MPDTTTSFHTALPPGDTPPEWVHLLPAGTFTGVDGRGPYTVASAEAVIAASMASGHLVLDENHATDHAQRTGQPAPAQGWIESMQSRSDGIWGRVEWTAPGRALWAARGYRGISPVFQHAAPGAPNAGAVSRILRAALTNVPNLPVTTLHAQDPDMDLLASLRSALGLPETTTAEAAIAAVQANCTAIAAHGRQMTAIAAAAGAPAGAGPDAIVTTLAARGSADALQTVTALQSQITAMQTERARDTATAAVDAAMRAGKPIPATLRADFIARHMADPAGFGALIDGMPSLNAGGLGGFEPNPPAGAGGIVGSDASVVALMGLDPEAYKKAKAAIETSMGAAA